MLFLMNAGHLGVAHGSQFEPLRVEHKRLIAGDKVLVTSIAESKNGILYIGTASGLYKIDGVLEEKVLSKTSVDAFGFVTSITPMQEKTLVSVYGKTIWLLDERGRVELEFYDKKN